MEIIVTSTKSVGKISNFKLAHAPYQGPIDYCITNVTSDRLRLKDINEFVKKINMDARICGILHGSAWSLMIQVILSISFMRLATMK